MPAIILRYAADAQDAFTRAAPPRLMRLMLFSRCQRLYAMMMRGDINMIMARLC